MTLATSKRARKDAFPAGWYDEHRTRDVSPWMFAAADQSAGEQPPLWRSTFDDMSFRAVRGADSIWIIAAFGSGARIALRAAYCPRGQLAVTHIEETDSGVRLRIDSAIGTFRTDIGFAAEDLPLLHVTTALRPDAPLTMPYWPRDLMPLGADGTVVESAGRIYAQQDGLRTGLLYASVTDPAEGSVLYLQNLTALNDYADQTGTTLADVVGGAWPELGLALPGSATEPLRDGHETILSDAYLAFSPVVPADDLTMAEEFLRLLAKVVVALPRVDTAYVDWPAIAEKSLRDLSECPDCTETVRARRFLHAYVGDRETPPESMVQLAVLLPLMEYARWRGEEIPLCDELLAGLPRFWDKEAGVLGRWMVSQRHRLDGAEPHRKPEIMDSWYLYHSLLNLARLAERGHKPARKLFLDSLDYAVEVAHRMDYEWPVFFNLYTLDNEDPPESDGEGEKDVGGLFAHVMLDAYDLTGEERFLTEAIAAADKLSGLGVRMFYQANVTLFGAAAMLRLAKLTGEERFGQLAYVALASAFANTAMWQCDYGHGAEYPSYFALYPLKGAPYVAVMEAIEGFSTMQHCLDQFSGPMPEWMTVLVPEFCRHLIERAGSYYPQNLPEAVVSDRPKTGWIDRRLWIPLEDLHDGREQAGQVGQEVYGSGAAFAILTRQYRRVPGAGFTVFAGHPFGRFEIIGAAEATIDLIGDPRFACPLRLIPDGRDPLLDVVLADGDGTAIEPKGRTPEGHLEYELRGGQTVTIRWRPQRTRSTAR